MDFDLRTTELGHVFSYAELQTHCRAIYGGVGWPGVRPGFAVVLAIMRERHFDGGDVALLAEYEDADTRKLVRWCGTMDGQYSPALWFGDTRNEAGDKFIQELAAELQSSDTSDTPRRSFSLCPTLIAEMTQPYSYMLPHLKRFLDPQRRTLFLKDSKIISYLGEIQENEIADLQIGNFPGIEAASYAVLGALECERPVRRQDPNYDPYAGNVLTRGFPQRRKP